MLVAGHRGIRISGRLRMPGDAVSEEEARGVGKIEALEAAGRIRFLVSDAPVTERAPDVASDASRHDDHHPCRHCGKVYRSAGGKRKHEASCDRKGA